VLKDMTELAERYDVRLATHISERSGAAEAILKEPQWLHDRDGGGGPAKSCSSAHGRGGFPGLEKSGAAGRFPIDILPRKWTGLCFAQFYCATCSL